MSINPLRKAAAAAAQPKRSPQQICEDGNASIAAKSPARTDIEWIVRDNKAMLVWRKASIAMLQETRAARIDPMDRRGQRMSESDTFALNNKLEELGSPYRYRWDGSRYHVSAQNTR